MQDVWTQPARFDPRLRFMERRLVRADFMRDWALIGALTSFITPFAVSNMLPHMGLGAFAFASGLVGGLSGLVVGWLLLTVLERVPEFARVSVSLVVGVPLLGFWGFCVGGAAALLTWPNAALLAPFCGGVSAMVMTVWLAPLYVWAAGRQAPTLPLVISASVLGSPVCAVASFVAAMGVMGALAKLAPYF